MTVFRAALAAVLLLLPMTARHPARRLWGRARRPRRNGRIVVRRDYAIADVFLRRGGVEAGGASGSPKSAERATSSDAASSQTAEIVSG